MADIATLGKDGVVGTICFQHNLFMASAIDIKTGIMLPDLMFVVQNKYATIKDFVNDIPNWFTKKFKAVILDVFDFQTPEYANNVEFCKAVQAKLNVNGIPHHFMASQDLAVFTWLYMAKLQVKVEQTILVISVNVIGYRVFCYQLTDKGYIFKDGEYVSGDKSDKMILKKILGIENKFAKILINDTNDDGILCDRLVNNVLHAFTDKITVQKDFNLNPESAFFHIGKCLVEAGKWIRNKKSSNTFILPSAVRQYMILTEIHGIYRALITVAPTVSLPVTESDALHKSSNIKFFLGYFDGEEEDNGKPTIVQQLTMPSQCHGYKFILTVDENNMPTCNVEVTMAKEIALLPLFLDMFCPSKIPVIGFCSNFSIICIHDDEVGYKFLEGWNGMIGKELFISFADKKPRYCEKALEDFSKKPSSVISHLVNIMAMPEDDVKKSLLWKFSIVKNSRNEVLVEFDNFDGSRKAASPAFLLAMLIKEHQKVIKNETGEKPMKFGFWFLNTDSDAVNERIKAGFVEACKLLKIEHVFIE